MPLLAASTVSIAALVYYTVTVLVALGVGAFATNFVRKIRERRSLEQDDENFLRGRPPNARRNDPGQKTANDRLTDVEKGDTPWQRRVEGWVKQIAEHTGVELKNGVRR